MNLLRTLRIRNLVIVEELTVEFAGGLNLLTGETGAGKSILVDALGLVGGSRADRSLVRAGATKAVVEALFEVDDGSPAMAWLRERDLAEDDEGQIVIRRDVAVEGAGRILINGSASTLGMLRELAEVLLELHGQHEPRNLLAADRHADLLDGFGGHLAERERVGLACAAARDAAHALADLKARAADRVSRVEDLRRCLREIDDLAPRVGELEELACERRVLQNAGRVAELLDGVVTATLEGEPCAASLAAGAAGKAEELADLDAALAELARRLRAAAVELDDAGTGFRDYRDRADFDPARLEAVEERRAALDRGCLRYATDEAGLLERRDAAAAELATLESFDDELAAAAEDVEQANETYRSAAAMLTRKRAAAAKKMEAAVERQFRALALDKAKFRVELSPARGETIPGSAKQPCVLSSRGTECAEFLFAANPGEPLRPLRQVASGGELSRVMLALHVVAESEHGRRVVVFDEIDAGVGGAVADAVGARLQRLAANRQLLCVTHLPQVAAYADRHFSVRKRVTNGRTRAGVADLDGSERIEELARMLGGKRATPTSRRHATELLRAAGRTPDARPRSQA